MMASALIHMAVASEVNKKLKKDNDRILIGSIAPDISKLVGETKEKSHFLDGNGDIPNIDHFLIKYKSKLDDDFIFGYFIHLYTDYLWFKYFIPNYINDDMLTKKDGTKVKIAGNMFGLYLYNDYSNINVTLLDEYNLDLHIFYNEAPYYGNIMSEIPMDKLQVLFDKMSIIIENSKENKEYIFDIKNIKEFIMRSVEFILAKIDELNL